MKKILLASIVALAVTANATDWIGFAQNVGNSKQLTAAIYPSYSPGLVLDNGKKSEWGAGLALMYPLGTDHVMAGVRMDWIADAFWTPSVTISPNAQFQVLGQNFTAFAIAGAIIPLDGAGSENGEVGATIGAGVYTTIWKPSEATSLQLFAAWERWTPVLNVNTYHLGAAFTVAF
jgi:hypothetical protein